MAASTLQLEQSRYVLISEFAVSLAAATGLDALRRDVIPKLRYIIDINRCTLALCNRESSSYQLLTLLDRRPQRSWMREENAPLDDGIHGEVILSGEPRTFNNRLSGTANLTGAPELSSEEASLHSIMCLPLRVGGHVIGSVLFGNSQDAAYAQLDVHIASTIATHLSLAVDRWHAMEKLSTAKEEVQRLNAGLEQRISDRTADLRKEIDEHRRAEAALRESKERYRSLYTETPVMLHSSDQNGRIVSVSDYWLRTLGYERGEVIGQFPTGFLTDASRKHAEENCFPVFMGTGVIVEEPLQFRKKNGELVDVLLSAIAERDVNNEIVRSLAVSVDVTRRRQAEAAVQRYTSRLEALQEIDRAILAARSPQAIAQAALGRIRALLTFDRASVAVFDFDRKVGRIIALHLENQSGPSLGSNVPLETFWKIDTLRQGGVDMVEDALQLPDDSYGQSLRTEGLRSWINVPLRVQDELIGSLDLGSAGAGTFSSEDIDVIREVADSLAIAIQQANLHHQVQRQAAELEQRVAERTAELEAFSYSVSHDLRAPLRAIDGFSRILLEDHGDKLDVECNRLLNTVCSEAQNMGQLIDDLLAFSRLTRQEITLNDVSMSHVVQAVADQLGSGDPQRDIQLSVGALPSAWGDRAMIQQVYVNLLSNAIKFTRDKTPAVIEVGHRREHGQDVYYVKDNGVGFDMQHAEKLFGVFERLHTVDQFEGTGVGLAIVQSIVQRHGGRIWAEGVTGEGAAMYFTLRPGDSDQ